MFHPRRSGLSICHCGPDPQSQKSLNQACLPWKIQDDQSVCHSVLDTESRFVRDTGSSPA